MSVEAAVDLPRTDSAAADRRFFFFQTILILLVAIVGFAPSSAGILGGTIPTPPLIVHLHAAAMLSWLLLLVAQAGLVTAGRRDLHMRLGLASLGLAPLMLVLFTAVTIIRYYDGVEAGAGEFMASLLFVQIRIIVMFPVFVIWALSARVRDPETHKRAMILAALVPIGAAIGRMAWIPGNDVQATYDLTGLLELALLAPALVYDKLRHGRVHRAYWIGLAATVPWLVAIHFVWGSAAWRSVAVALMGAP
ncbi:MAG TPA: hypothetical protein VF405_01945 [Gammaproteobacteria bacterium]